MIWAVNGENGYIIYGAKSEESIPHSKSNVLWYDYVELLENSSWDLSRVIQSSVHIHILVHISNHPWRNSRLDHFIVKGRVLFTIILRLVSLDVVWSWTTSKDKLTSNPISCPLVLVLSVIIALICGNLNLI